MAKDREGRDVFLADSGYVLQMAQMDFKHIKFHFTSCLLYTSTVPGEITFSPFGYFCVIDKESFPVGTLICSAQQKSLNAFTAVYRLSLIHIFPRSDCL